VPLGAGILLSLAGLVAIAILLRRYYASSATMAPAARPMPVQSQPH
jgi:hypothetical protein